MTTYSSQTRTPFVPVVPGHEPFSLSDAYVLSGAIPPPEAYLSPADTLDGGLSWTGIMDALEKTPRSHAETRDTDGAVPVRYVVFLFLGLVLTALAMVGLWLRPLIHMWLTS